MANSIWLAPTQNFIQTTLNGGITSGAQSFTITSASNLPGAGYLVIDRTDSNGLSTPNNREVVTYTSIVGANLNGVTRGVDGSTARAHADGAIVETMPTVGMWNSLATIVSAGLDTQGLLNATASPVTISLMQIASGATVSGLFVRSRIDLSTASITGLGLSPVFIGGGSYSGPTIALGGLLVAPRYATLLSVSAFTKYVASGGSVGFDFLVRGASVFANATTRPAIVAGGTFVSTASIATVNINPGDMIQADIATVMANSQIQEVTVQAFTV